MNTKIEIKQIHIDRGIPMHKTLCPMAWAIGEALPLVSHVVVDRRNFIDHTITLRGFNGEITLVRLHSSIPLRFDLFHDDIFIDVPRTNKVIKWLFGIKPCSFELDVPDWALPKEKPVQLSRNYHGQYKEEESAISKA